MVHGFFGTGTLTIHKVPAFGSESRFEKPGNGTMFLCLVCNHGIFFGVNGLNVRVC